MTTRVAWLPYCGAAPIPADAARGGDPMLGTAGHGLAALLVLDGWRLLGREGATNWSPTAAILLACSFVAAALAADWFSWRAQGIVPELTGQGAMSHAMHALQGQLVAAVLLMAVYLAARTSRGLITRPRNTTFDVAGVMLAAVACQAATALF